MALYLFVIKCLSMHFDFMEIGTSNFATMTQSNFGFGISVEALSIYLDQLPDNPKVIKVHGAVIGNTASTSNILFYYVDPKDINNYKLPWWIKGCNNINEPHPEAWQMLNQRKLSYLMKNISVPTTSYTKLINTYDVRSLQMLKLDMEGFEFPVLNEMLSLCKLKQLCPNKIQFERKHMIRRNKNASIILKHDINTVFHCGGKTNLQSNDLSDFTCIRNPSVFI